MQNPKLSLERLGAIDYLTTENAELQTKVEALTTKVQRLNVGVKDLTKHLLNAHAIESSRIKCLFKSFLYKHP